MGRPRIVIIGSGNVATHLSLALDDVAEVVQVFSTHIDHAKALASNLKSATVAESLSCVAKDADYYLISVYDDAISSVADALSDVNGVVMHTSGSIGIEALSGAGGSHGVFYPLQTFSKATSVDVSEVPFFIEGEDEATAQRVETLARMISALVYRADSAQRASLHIAAVFACNFTNHLLDISSEILNEHGYNLEVLYPLLKVTLSKAMTMGPHAAQTGPAVRHDVGVISKHIESLPADKAMIYDVLTQHIIDYYSTL